MIDHDQFQIENTARYVIRGSSVSERSCTLAAFEDLDDAAGSLDYWSTVKNSYPFHHDVHIAREITTTTYERVE